MINRIAVCAFCMFLGWVLRGVVDTIRRTRRAELEHHLAYEQISTCIEQLHEHYRQTFTKALGTLGKQFDEIAVRDSQLSQTLDELEQERDRLLAELKG